MTTAVAPWRSRVRHVFLSPVHLYRRWLSPLKPCPTCRFVPTCSQYAVEAVETRGIVVGSLKTFWRLLRCNPLCAGGYDPVNSDSVNAPRFELAAACSHSTPKKNETK